MWTLLEGFRHLNSEELDALLEAPLLITALVGAADGALDREERRWADRLMQTRTYSNPKALNEYYRVVANDFLDKLDRLLARLPESTPARNNILAEKLAQINPVLAQLELSLGADLYKSYMGLARETARASGGFLRIGAISSSESEWVELPMLNKIVGPPKEDGEAEDEWDEDKKDDSWKNFESF